MQVGFGKDYKEEQNHVKTMTSERQEIKTKTCNQMKLD